MLRRAPSLPLASLASRLVLPSHRPASHAVAHGHDDHHGPPLDGPDVHPTLRTPAYHPGTRTHQPPALLPDTPSVLPPALKARIPPLPEEEDRPVRTDPRILPLPGNRFWGVYDHLSAVNPVTTRRPIWDVGPRESRRWPDGKVPPLWLIEYGWEKMDEEARARLEGHLKDRQKQDWRDLSLVEKKAIWHLAYGPWGTRAPYFKHNDGPLIILFGTPILLALLATYKIIWTYLYVDTLPKPSKQVEIERQKNHWKRANNIDPDGISADNYGGQGDIPRGAEFGKGTTY